jgi:hypothetical protein
LEVPGTSPLECPFGTQDDEVVSGVVCV